MSRILTVILTCNVKAYDDDFKTGDFKYFLREAIRSLTPEGFEIERTRIDNCTIHQLEKHLDRLDPEGAEEDESSSLSTT